MTTQESRLQSEFFAGMCVGEFDHSNQMRRIATEQSISFIGGARHSEDPTLFRFGLFRRICGVASLHYSGDEVQIVRRVYADWASTQHRDSFSMVEHQPTLPTGLIRDLAEQGDPAILAVHYLESQRLNNYPDYPLMSQAGTNRRGERVKISELQTLYCSYEMILRSIHGPQITELGSTAIADS
jgi:hypothetical protein